ncbi:MAG TPA: hypothetical protein VGE32_16390 [Cellvibrio sp.]
MNRLAIAILFISAVMPSLATANDCTYWQQQINKVSRWSNTGDNAAQQQRWQRQQNYLQEQLAKCQGTTPGPISVARGQQSNNASYAPLNYLKSDSADAELQQLIATCNRWIDIYNNSPTFENQSTRDTACRTATNKEALLKNPKQAAEIKIKRSVKDCIKPNNVIDHEVKACMQGLKEPDWNKVNN